eukprot:TRINITY_DN45740_c0_g1_i1.p1 TRINITY_DN45740_c0_g1~~TRINITY_DN45740_c0_g1_i1.p1  ORF type:complete len:297 (+),score=26.71 TRINITY_DN45740_c0_g1_i1:107-892(+)
MACAGPQMIIKQLSQSCTLSCWLAVGIVALLASDLTGMVRWPYVFVHSLWHVVAFSYAGAVVQASSRGAVVEVPVTDMLVVGLGNPGLQYEGTRHNVGTKVIQVLAKRHGVALSATPHHARAARISIGTKSVIIAHNDTFMNRSGKAVASLCKAHEISDPENVVIVHDELDLLPGLLRLKLGGSEAGHNGLRSIVSCIGSSSFLRVRIGVGKPPKDQGAKWVLGHVDDADVPLEKAADAIEMILESGFTKAMNSFNRRTGS